MSGAIVQYLGFKPGSACREYKFTVREAGEEREFRLTIAHDDFVSHGIRYQDAPGICAVRLRSELAAHSNHPVETVYVITGAELDGYRRDRLLKSGRKAEEDF